MITVDILVIWLGVVILCRKHIVWQEKLELVGLHFSVIEFLKHLTACLMKWVVTLSKTLSPSAHSSDNNEYMC